LSLVLKKWVWTFDCSSVGL